MKFGTFDIEAKNWTEFQTLGFFDGETYETFFDIDAFLGTVLDRKYASWHFFAHYGGKYDFNFLLDRLVENGFSFEIIEAGSRIIEIKVKISPKQNVYFNDSYALLPFSLEKLTKTFDVIHKKKKVDFETIDFYSNEALKYLEYDVKGLYEVLDQFKNWGLHRGKLKKTLASQSMYVFRKYFSKTNLVIPNPEQDSFFRQCYFGGRVEIFKMFGEGLKYFDVNSLYPYCMTLPMPTGFCYQTRREMPDRIGFYKAIVSIPDECHIPPIGVVCNSKLIFPVGEFESFITSADIPLIKKVGGTYQIESGFYFDSREPIFKEYVTKLYSIKEQSTPGGVDYTIAKLELNSLYGKFGQRKTSEQIVRASSYREIINKGMKPYFEEYGFYKKEVESKSMNLIPYLACYITSLARTKLYELILEAGMNNVWYCDTDSLITTHDFKTGPGLGELKLEYCIEEGAFLQPKGYAFRAQGLEKVRLKGFREHGLTFGDIKDAVLSSEINKIRAEYHRIIGFRENLKRFKSLKIRRLKILKKLRKLYDKRTITENFETKPIKLERVKNGENYLNKVTFKNNV